jgi:hypothetical protein
VRPILGTSIAALLCFPALAEAPLVLKAGTIIPLLTRSEVSSRTHRQGDRFELEVSDPVLVGGLVVIPKGAVATGEVARHRSDGAFGREGRLEVTLLYVTVGGRNIRLQGQESKNGMSGAVPAYAAGVVVAGILGAAIKGKDAVIPSGTPMTGLVYRDVPLIETGR